MGKLIYVTATIYVQSPIMDVSVTLSDYFLKARNSINWKHNQNKHNF